jgi:hypothetical protein
MLLRLLKSNTPLAVFLPPLIGVIFWIHSFQSPLSLSLILVKGAMPLYYLIFNYIADQDFLQVILAFCLVITNSFIIAWLGSSFLILKKRSPLPGIIYLITVSSLPALHALLPVHLATLFVIISMYFIFDAYHKKVEISNTFNASFFLALASLFYLPVLTLFPLVWISVFVLQKDDNWRVLVIPVLGFGLPWLFMLTYSFLNDSTASLWTEMIRMLWTRHNSYLFEPYFLVLTTVVTFLTTLGSVSVLSGYHLMKVSSRKYFVIFYWMLGLLVVSALMFMTIGIEIVVLSTIPVSFFISNYLLSDQKTVWKEIATWIYLGTMVFAVYFY